MVNVDWTLHYLHDHCEILRLVAAVVNFSPLWRCDCWTVKTMMIMMLMVQRVMMLVFSW